MTQPLNCDITTDLHCAVTIYPFGLFVVPNPIKRPQAGNETAVIISDIPAYVVEL